MGANLPNLDLLIQAGIDQKTGLPKQKADNKTELKTAVKRQLRIQDEQVAVNRYQWFNLPSSLDGQLLERILYYKGQAAFFYMPSNGSFYFLPYALTGSVDVYGRFMGITPLQFAGGTTSNEKGKERPWINGLEKKPIYEVPFELTDELLTDGCVILKDYTPQLAETILPRKDVMDSLLDAMAEALPFARTSLIANSGVRGIRVQGEDDALNVIQASKTIEKSALDGNPFVPIQGSTEFQDLTGGAPLKSEEYLLYMQGLDNYRLSLYGLSTGGLFQKKSHMLESEQDMNAGHAKLAYEDGLKLRQKFCDIVNSIWGLGIWCEPSESVIEADMTGDGLAVDKEEPTSVMASADMNQGDEE